MPSVARRCYSCGAGAAGCAGGRNAMRCLGHRTRLCTGLVILGLLAVSGAPRRAQHPLAAAAAATTAAVASFTAPADWRVGGTAALRLLDPPEGDSHIAVVDVQAADATAALAAAWAAYRPGANRPLKIALA